MKKLRKMWRQSFDFYLKTRGYLSIASEPMSEIIASELSESAYDDLKRFLRERRKK